jgi:uncharacterized protein
MNTLSSRDFPGTNPPWLEAGYPYYAYNQYLRGRFGHRVQKVSIDAGFTCPNVDGTVTTGGCTFCDNRSFSPSRRLPRQSILSQIDEGIRQLQRRYDCEHFLAYFQPATNTYAAVDRLEKVYREALSHDRIVGICIGTRPDCLGKDILDFLEALGKQTYLQLELGIQTIHEASLRWMNRGHGYAEVPAVVEACLERNLELGVHVILGLPGETHEDMMATAREVGRLGVKSIKIHNLYAVKDTPLAEQVARGEVQLMDRDSYIRTLVDFLELLPPTMVVERVSGDAPGDYFIGPSWCLDKPGVLISLRDEFRRRGTYQSRLWRSPVS